MYRARQHRQHPIIFQISLQLHQILISPGTKMSVRTAPLQKFPGSLFKRNASRKILVIHMYHLMDTVMDPLIHSRFDQSLKCIRNFFPVIHFYRADFDYLKGQTTVCTLFSVRTLIPLQVKDNIIHTIFPLLIPLPAQKQLQSDIPGISRRLHPSAQKNLHPLNHIPTSENHRWYFLWTLLPNSPRPESPFQP